MCIMQYVTVNLQQCLFIVFRNGKIIFEQDISCSCKFGEGAGFFKLCICENLKS